MHGAFCTSPATGLSAEIAKQMQELIPVIETDRLILRAPLLEDFDAFWEMLKSPGGHFFGDADSFEDVWAEFLHLAGQWPLRGHGGWAVTLRETGAVAGFVQIGAEPGDMEPELGWIFAPDARGKGLSDEAAIAARGYAFGQAGIPSLVSYVDPDNAHSQRLAERLGAVRDAAAEAALPDADKCLAYRHPVGGVA